MKGGGNKNMTINEASQIHELIKTLPEDVMASVTNEYLKDDKRHDNGWVALFDCLGTKTSDFEIAKSFYITISIIAKQNKRVALYKVIRKGE